MDNYEQMGTAELRKLIRERGLGSGLALSSANKNECMALLRGEISWRDYETGKSAKSDCQAIAGNSDAMAQIAAGLAALMPAQKVDMEEVRKLAVDAGHDAAINAVTDVVKAELDSRLAPTRVVVEDRKLNVEKNVGVVHKRFPLLLAMCQARDKDGYVPPIYLYGPAGTGKTTTAKKIAEALGLDFHYNGAIGNAYELSGFIDAGGRFQETEFYKAYANGGVYLFDELDSSMPGAVLAFNAALANGHAAFPIGNVKRHKDCIILAAGNTCMRGDGNMSGFQRIKQDAAFRDRFTYLEWPIDEALEASMAAAYGDEWGWLDMVRRYRRNAERAGIKDFEVTPRAVDRGLAMLKAGIDLHDVVEMCVRKGLNADAWKKVEGRIMTDTKFHVYEGLAAFADGYERRNIKVRDEEASWCGGTVADALAFARHGDMSHVAEAERLLEKLDTEIDSNAVRPMWTPSVVGNFPLVPAYLAGTPEAMLARTDVPDARGEIEIWANTTVSGSCSTAGMVRRGVVTLAFAMALSRVRNVRIVVYSTLDGSNVAVRLACPLDISEACAAFCQPSVTRQLFYRHAEPDGSRGKWASWAEVKRGGATERKALIDYAGMPEDAVRLGTEKLGSYAGVGDDELVEILNKKLREVAGKEDGEN